MLLKLKKARTIPRPCWRVKSLSGRFCFLLGGRDFRIEFTRTDGGDQRIDSAGQLYERSFRGKTSDREDMINGRFVELAPPRRIVEAVSFVTTDPAFFGEMTLVVTFDEVPGGTDVTFLCENLPPGLRPQDNEAGSRLSLEQLARRFE